MYHGQNSQTSIGHYTAHIRNGTNWIVYDDMLRKSKKVYAEIKSNVNLCI